MNMLPNKLITFYNIGIAASGFISAPKMNITRFFGNKSNGMGSSENGRVMSSKTPLVRIQSTARQLPLPKPDISSFFTVNKSENSSNSSSSFVIPTNTKHRRPKCDLFVSFEGVSLFCGDCLYFRKRSIQELLQSSCDDSRKRQKMNPVVPVTPVMSVTPVDLVSISNEDTFLCDKCHMSMEMELKQTHLDEHLARLLHEQINGPSLMGTHQSRPLPKTKTKKKKKKKKNSKKETKSGIQQFFVSSNG